jgi:hypothetical protein
MLGFYNKYSVLLTLAVFIALSYKELLNVINSIFTYRIEFDVKEGNYLKLITTEFFFIVSSLVLSVTLISIFRPFPIGWDDL